MKQLLAIAFLFLALQPLYGQPDSAFHIRATIPVAATDFAIDNLENLYLVTTTNQLKKLSPKGDSLGVYNDVKRFGRLHSLDVSNPLKLLLFYKDFSTVVVLDRFLAQKGILDLRRRGMAQASAVATSYDNNIWVFDVVENKLKKLDESGRVLMETPDFRQLLGSSISPDKIIDQDGWVYLYDPAAGVFIFDYYGAFQKKFPLTGWASFQVVNKRVTSVNGSALIFYNPATFTEQQYQFPSSFGSFNRYLMGNSKLFALGRDSLSIFSLSDGR